MSDNQRFCLRWNNHQSTLVQAIHSLLSSGVLVDCTLAAEGQFLHAHKVVLCVCSPYLETLLSQHYEKHPIVVLKDVKFSELKYMMEYMYKGEVDIPQNQLGQFLNAAESLQIKGLVDGCGGENYSRDVGSTTQKEHESPLIRKIVPHNQSRSPVVLPSQNSGLTIEPSKRSLPSHFSPVRLPEGSVSPTLRKHRRSSQSDDDGHQMQENCDLPLQQQNQQQTILNTVPIIPQLAVCSSSTMTKSSPPSEEAEGYSDWNIRLAESFFRKENIEPQSKLPVEPKTKYTNETNNNDVNKYDGTDGVEWHDYSSEFEDILYHKTKDGIAKITINRPNVRNAFRPQTVKEMMHALSDARYDNAIGSIILTGQGEKAFCAGGDQKIRGDYGGYKDDTGVHHLNVLDFQRQIRTCPKPIVAMVAGYAIGGGHVLHMMCDLTIAADNAIFGQSGPKVGSFDGGWGASYMARIVGQKKAREIWFLCRHYDAQSALDMGLVNQVVPYAELECETVRWCREILKKSPMALRCLKAALNADCDGQAGLQELAGNATMLFYMTEESQEGRNAFNEKREADFSTFERNP